MPTIDLSKTPRVMAPKYRKLLTDIDARFLVLYGGAGAAKSYSVAQAIVYSCLFTGGHRWLVCRKVGNSMRHSVVALILHILESWGMRGLYSHNKAELTMSFWSGSQIIFTGLDDVGKLRSIHGITGVWVEEADETVIDDYRQLNLRLRGKSQHRKRFYVTFNPVNATHWLKGEFFDQPKDNAFVMHTTYKDNPFLDDEYRAELESITDPYYRAVYVDGEWGELGNVVFTDYVIEDFSYAEGDLSNVSQGLDFGYNHPSVAIRYGERDGDLYVFAEVSAREKTNAEFIELVQAMDPDYKKHRYIAESAEPDRIKEFRQAGFNVTAAVKGQDSVRHGIDWLKRHRIHIHPRCGRLAKEIQAYKWQEDRNGNTLDKPVEFFDDALAALRYASEPFRRVGKQVFIGRA